MEDKIIIKTYYNENSLDESIVLYLVLMLILKLVR